MLKTLTDTFTDDDGSNLSVVSCEFGKSTSIEIAIDDESFEMEFDVDALGLLIDTLQAHRDHLLMNQTYCPTVPK